LRLERHSETAQYLCITVTAMVAWQKYGVNVIMSLVCLLWIQQETGNWHKTGRIMLKCIVRFKGFRVIYGYMNIRHVRLTTLLPSVSQLSRQYGILNISEAYWRDSMGGEVSMGADTSPTSLIVHLWIYTAPGSCLQNKTDSLPHAMNSIVQLPRVASFLELTSLELVTLSMWRAHRLVWGCHNSFTLYMNIISSGM
jgi:hypothetical protein